MKKLVELLGEDLHKQVIEKLGGVQVFLHDKDQKVLIDDGSYIPKHRFDEVNETNKSLKTQIAKSESDLVELKKAASGNEEFLTKIKTLEADNKKSKEDFEKSELKLKKSLAVKEELLNAGVLDPDARELLLSKFNIDELVVDESGKLKEFETKLKPIKEHKTLSALFGETKIEGTNHKEGLKPLQNGLFSMDQIKSMSEAEVQANLELVNKSMAAGAQETK
jgi:hypothetical protein